MTFLNKNKLLSDAQSGLRTSDSWEYQLLSIIHDIYKSFACNQENYLDISENFDRVWHDVLIQKIKSFRIYDTPLKLIEKFVSNIYQRVVLNGQSSSWTVVSAGVPQGSVLGPLFFLMYFNDLICGLSSTTKLFADDTSLFSVVYDITQSTNELNDDLAKLSNWASQWKMSFNSDKQA